MNPWTKFFEAIILPNRPSSNGPMSRFMRTEHRKDYDNAIRMNGYVSEEYAREYIKRIHI